MSRILRFFACLAITVFAGNAFAAGYSCDPSLPTYLSCQIGYYMTANSSSTTHDGTPKVGNYCQPCSRKGSNYTCAGGTAAPVETAGGYTCPTYKKYTSCSTGYYMTDSSTSTTYNGTPKAGNACRPCSVYGANYTCSGGTDAPQEIKISVTCPAGQYLPDGKTACETCPAGSFCRGGTFKNISLVTGADSDKGRGYCEPATNDAYPESAAGSSSMDDCYLTLSNGNFVPQVNAGTQQCPQGSYCYNGGRNIYYDLNGTERDLTDSRPTVGGADACARGAYSSAGASGCTACSAGQTTSGTGSTSCDATCSNSTNVSTWKTPQWTPNNVSNLCKIDSCVACTKGTGVASCSTSIVNNACTYTATCATGYKNPACNGSSCSCTASTYTITLNDNSGSGGTGTAKEVYATKWTNSAGTTITSVTAPSRSGYTFRGYYTAQVSDLSANGSTGTQRVTKAGALPGNTTFTADATLYAAWAKNCTQPSNGTCSLSVSDAGVVTYTTSCNPGYTTSGNGTATPTCTANTYTVVYNKNATSATGTMSNSSHTYGTSKALTTNAFTNGTKKFLGWSTSSTATSATYTNGQSVSNLTTTNGGTVNLYAVWGNCDACAATGADCTLTAPNGVCTYTTSCKDGYYGITNNGKYNASCSACSALTPAVAVTGGTYSSVSPRNANTTCRYKAPTPTLPTYCATKTSNTISYSGTAWGTNIYTVTAKAGSIISGNNTKDATCTQCVLGSTSAGGSASSCTACQSGKTTSAAGQSSCNATCPNATNVSAWKTATWNTNNTMTNLCTIDNTSTSACTAAVKGTGAASATWTVSSNKCVYSGTCNAKYVTPTVSGTTVSCSACPAAYPNSVQGNTYANDNYCYLTLTAGQQVASAGAGATACKAGWYCTSTANIFKGTAGGTTTYTGTACAQGSYTDTTGKSACTACTNGKTTSGTGKTSCDATCSNSTTNVNSWKTATWSANSVANLCTINECKNSTFLSSNACSACPAAESGWSLGTGTGWTAVTSCFETKSVGGNCSAGQLKKNATSTTAWGTTKISTPLQAKPGYIVSGQTCTGCAAGTYSAGSTATSCSACTGRTKYSAANASACSTVSTGYYTTGCDSSNNNCTGQSQCTSGTWCASGVQNQCSSLTGVSVSGGTYTSAAGSSANTACKYTAPNKTITGCKTVTTNTVTYSGTAWPATTYGVTANGGYIISGNNTAAATCSRCDGAVWSAGGTATSCSACPDQTSGWTRNTGTGWSAVTQCNQTKSVGGNCSAGVLKQNATSTTAWGTTTISTSLQAKPGYIVSGQTCTGCAAGTYSAGGTATSCSACTGRTKYSAANASACSTVSTGYYTTGCNSNNNNCTGQSQCTSGTWCASGVQNQCSSLSGVSVTGGTYTSAAGSSANTACKYTAPNKTITGCKTVTTNTVTYSGTAWPETTYGVTANGGYIISGNNTAAATCSRCDGAVWSAGGTATSCSACPDQTSGWTRATGTGWTSVGSCYQTKNATAISSYCQSGQLKQTGKSSTEWNTATVSATFNAKAGSIVTGSGATSSCSQCGNWTFSGGGTATSCTACPDLESGWTKASGTGWSSYSNCKETKTGTAINANCSAGVLTKTASSATAWGSAAITTALQAKAGSYVNGQTCTQCNGAVWSAGGTATNCSACPDQTSGWTRATGTGWTSVGSCYQTKNATAISSYCQSGQLKQTGKSSTEWNTATVSATFNAKAGSIVTGSGATSSCSQCNGAVWSAGGTATSCSACPDQTSGWTRNSGTGWTAVTQCNQTKSVGGNCSAGVLKQNATSTTAWGSSTISTPLQAKPGYIVSGQTCTGCAAGTYSAGSTATSCSACTGRTKYSAANASACSTVSTGYYTTGCNSSNNNCTGQSQCTSGTWCASGVQNQCSSLSGVSVTGGTYTSAAGSSANTACKYTAPSKTITGCKTVTTNTVTYSGTAWPETTYGVTANGGYIISGNNTAAATCSQCGTAKYSAGGTATSCSSCPNADSGWTVTSPAGSTAYTACYEYQTPVNCASGSVKRAASSATAYSSTISLLSTLKSKAGYYASTTATSCTICPTGSSCAASATAPTPCANWTYAASTGMSSCTACPALTSNWTKADSTGTGWKSHTNCVQISPTPANCAGGNLKQVAASNGATTWGTSTVNSALSSNPGYYINGTACSACTGATYYGGGTATSCTPCPSIYTSNTTAAKSKAEQCTVQTTGGYYIKAAKDSAQTECDGGYYCPSATVAYGSTNTQTACPVAADHKRATIPAEYYTNSIAGTSLSSSKRRSAITQCQVLNTYNGTRGSLFDYLTYNTTTQKYDVQGAVLWFKANPGYYLTTATGCGTYAYYGVAKECDKNAYCPGKDQVACNADNQATVQVEKFGLELCSALGNGKYATSDGGAAAKSTAACYLTTSNAKFVATVGAAEGACTAGGWCPGGVRVNYGSTGGRTTCPTTYPSSADGSNSELDCYVTTAAGKYVATVGAGQVNCAGTGYYCPGGTNVYSGAYGSRLTTGGRTQCPAGYRDLVATASTTKEAQCTMNVAGGKYVATAKESAASGTCAAGYAKAAHSVTYGNTSSCAACTGATYAASTGQASCTTCPAAKTYASAVKSYGYWNRGQDGDHTISDGCYATMTGTLSNGSLTEHGCYLGTDGDYGNGGGKRCWINAGNLKCNAGYYASTLSNGYVWNNTRAGLLGNTCVGVGAGYYSAANILTRNQCPTGLTTIGYGAGADEVTDCGRILHFGNDKLYLRSGRKTTPSLNVKIGDTTYYGNMTAGTGKGKLRLKSGTTTYSVHDDSM